MKPTNNIISYMDSDVLAGLLKRVGNFNNGNLEGRIIFQKTVYSLQAFGLKLGYNFSWYHYGPYCTELAAQGYQIAPKFEEYKATGFVSASDEKKFKRALQFIGENASNPRWLEMAASIHMLKIIRRSSTKDEIYEEVSKKQHYLKNRELFEDAWKRMREFDLIG